jgi:uncharacterized protein YuzE
MHWTYDADDRALYIQLDDASPVARQVEMPDGTIVDVADDGHAIGIEVIRSWADWDLGAVAERFALDRETASVVGWIADSPLVRSTPLHSDERPVVGLETAAESSPEIKLEFQAA